VTRLNTEAASTDPEAGHTRPWVIVNRHATGCSSSQWTQLRPRLVERFGEDRIAFTTHRLEAELAIRRAIREQASCVVVVGGDGTINLAVHLLAGQDVPLAVVPSGAANDLARALRLPPLPSLIGRGTRIDVIEVNGRRFCTVGGLGLPARVAIRANRLRAGERRRRLLNPLGRALYPLLAAEQVLLRPRDSGPLRLSYLSPGSSSRRERVVRADGLFVANQAHLAGDLRICPGAVHDDGVFELCILHSSGRLKQSAALARLLAGMPLPPEILEIVPATGARIELHRPAWFFGEGDPLVEDRVFEVSIRSRALAIWS
jgi:diacylglycerol kinase family enzyme